MKKSLLIVSLLCFSLFAGAQTIDEDEEVVEAAESTEEPQQEKGRGYEGDTLGAHPYDLEQNQVVAPEVSHWSLIGHIGFNSFDGDFTSEMAHPIGLPSAGLDIEYCFTPVWSMGIEYMFSQYNVTGKQPEEGGVKHNADTLLNGYMHKAGIYLAMDLANLMFPNMQKKIFSMQPFVGGGIGWYKRNVYFKDDGYYNAQKGKWINPTHTRGNTANYINADGDFGYGDYDTAYNYMPFLQVGINFEFNINRSIALGIRGSYSYFTRDYLDGRGANLSDAAHASKNNDGIFDVTLAIRYKIQPRKYTHERNVAHMGQHQAEEKALKALSDAIAKANNPDSIGDGTGDGSGLAGLAGLLGAGGTGSGGNGECCHDTIIYYRDTVILRESSYFEHIENGKDLETYYYVYFENNKALLNDEALITIQQVAERLQEDTSLYAVVTGYCDNTGSNKLNYALGDRRAANVVDELKEEHAINTDHMFGLGVGKVIGRRSKASYSPNRRAAIRLVDRETFLKMKKDLEDQRANRVSDPNAVYEEPSEEVKPQAKPKSTTKTTPKKTLPLSQTARPEKVNEYQQRESGEVTVEESTTLSKLARQYYNNTYCWVYIYIANKDKIKNPNSLPQGIKLTIPELTPEELRITKDEGLVLFNNARK